MDGWLVCVCTFAVKCGRYSSVGKNFSPFLRCLLSLSFSFFLTFTRTQTNIHFLFLSRSEALCICIWSATVALGFCTAVFFVVVLHTRQLYRHSIPFIYIWVHMHLLCVNVCVRTIWFVFHFGDGNNNDDDNVAAYLFCRALMHSGVVMTHHNATDRQKGA